MHVYMYVYNKDTACMIDILHVYCYTAITSIVFMFGRH